MNPNTWYRFLELSKISDEERYRILDYVVRKVGRDKVQQALNVSRITMWRLLNKKAHLDNAKLRTLLSFLSEREFRDILSSRKLLEATNIVRPDGTVNYSVIMEALKLAVNDEYLKQLIIKFIAENFREDIKKAIGVFPATVTLHWDTGFEEFLRKMKKGKKITDERTLRDYRNLFTKVLEGKQLTPELVDYVINYPNQWLRNIFRHYVRYLYHKRKIPQETFGWIMEVVPARKYSTKVRAREIDIEHVVRSIKFLKEKHELYYLYYILMYYSGARLKHVMKMIAEYNPKEVVKIEITDSYTERLICFEDRGFCRYYLGIHTGKDCEWIYFPHELLPLIEKYKGTKRWDDNVSKYAREHNLVGAKVFRELHWQVLKKVIDKDVVRFIQTRFEELEVSASSYDNLLRDSNIKYPKTVEVLKKGLQNPQFIRDLLLEKIKY